MSSAAVPDPLSDLLLLHRIAQRINGQLELEPLLEEIVSDVALTFGYSRAAVLLIDGESSELVIAAVRGWTTNFHVQGDRLPSGYGIIGHVARTGETYYAPDVTADPRYQVSEPRTRSELDIPLRAAGGIVGVFSFQHHERHAFSDDRIRLLEALAGHVGTAVSNALLFAAERREKQRLVREQQEAQRIQQLLFPSIAPAVPGFQVTGLCVPCLAVGGDWYDYIPLADDRLGIVVADVAGKGMAAALLMSSTRSLLRQVAPRERSPAMVLTRLNRLLLTDFPLGRFVTMLYAVLDPSAQLLTFAAAGHLPPLRVDSQTGTFLGAADGLPLGISDSTYSDITCELATGGRFVMYSDGVTEASRRGKEKGEEEEEEYGADRLRACFAAPSASAGALLDDLRRFTGSDVLQDDATVVTVTAI